MTMTEEVDKLDLSPILKNAEEKISSASVKERIGIFAVSLFSAVSHPNSDFSSSAQHLSSLIFRTLLLYHDRTSQASVERLLLKCVQRDISESLPSVTIRTSESDKIQSLDPNEHNGQILPEIPGEVKVGDQKSDASEPGAASSKFRFVKFFVTSLALFSKNSNPRCAGGLASYKLLKWSSILLRTLGGFPRGLETPAKRLQLKNQSAKKRRERKNAGSDGASLPKFGLELREISALVKLILPKLTAVQNKVLCASQAEGGLVFKRSCLRCTRRLLSVVPGLYSLYISELKSAPLSLESCGIIGALLDFAYMSRGKGKRSEGRATERREEEEREGENISSTEGTSLKGMLSKEDKAFLIDSYLKLILSAKEKPPLWASTCFQLLLRNLSEAEFGSEVCPTAVKMLKRNPEIATEAIGVLFASASLIDLGPIALEFFPTLLQQARHNNEVKREEANSVIQSLVSRCKSADVSEKLFQHVKAVYEGSEGKLSNPYQKLGLMNSLRILASFSPLPASSLSGLTAKVCNFHVSVFSKESNEEVQLSVLSNLGLWLGTRTCEGVPSSVVEFLANGVAAPPAKIKENVRRGFLHCIRRALRNLELRIELISCVDPLLTLIKSSLTKPTLRVEGFCSLLICASVAAVHAPTETKMTKEKVWSNFLHPESPFISPTMVLKVSDSEDLLALIEFVEIILLRHMDKLSVTSLDSHPIFQLAIALLWHPSPSVRKQSFAMIARCQVLSTRLSFPLFVAFSQWLMQLQETVQASVSSAGGDEGKADMGADCQPPSTLSSSPSSLSSPALIKVSTLTQAQQLLSRAFLLLVSPDLVETPEACGRVLLTAHHPLLVAGRDQGVLWRATLSALDKRGVDMKHLISTDPSHVAQVLVGPLGLSHSSKSQSAAATSAMGSIMSTIPGVVFDDLFQELLSFSDLKLHSALTDSDVQVFETKEGVLANVNSIHLSDTPLGLVNVREMKKGGGGGKEERVAVRPSHSIPSSKPASALGKGSKRDSNQPSKPKGKADASTDKPRSAKEEAVAAQLKAESAVRERVKVLKRKGVLLLGCLGEMAEANRTFAHDVLPVMVDVVFPLLRSKVLSSEAFACIVRLMTCLAPALQPISFDVASALRTVATSASDVAAQLKPSLAGADVTDSSDDVADADVGSRGERGREKKGVVERVVGGLNKACALGPLPATTFGACFPILEQILLAPFKTRLHDDVLRLMELHSNPYIRIQRPQMINVLYHVLSVVPVYGERVQPLLRELCRGLQAHELNLALSGLESPHSHVRAACLDAVKFVPSLAAGHITPSSDIAVSLWIAQHDPDKSNTEAAELLWDLYGHELSEVGAKGGEGAGEGEGKLPGFLSLMLQKLSHENRNVRKAAAGGLSSALGEFPQYQQEVVSTLLSSYVQSSPPSSSPFASQEDEVKGLWRTREGVAFAFLSLSDLLSPQSILLITTFLISKALADPRPEVRYPMIDAGVALVGAHGKKHVAVLLSMFENFLNKQAEDEHVFDLVREGVVIFLGSLGKHLTDDDAKISSILSRLISVLSTPSESVQRAVSDCLPPLIKAQKDKAASLLDSLLSKLLLSPSFAERKGAAFGVGAVVKGMGVWALKERDVVGRLKAALEDKAKPAAREGALFGFECLSEKLGKLFEPYSIHILPFLLVCFSDSVSDVRSAAEHTAKVIMSKLTGQGVKLVLPALLRGLEDKAWRTKQGSVQLLGAMAYCAPKQLSHCLPTIVPKLSEVLTDTHPKVQQAAQLALKEVGSVIRNPEICSLVSTLLQGIANPSKHNKTALDLLLQTTFVNTVDAASLSLLVPIIHRGMRERNAETKKKAAQIAGSMSTLVTDQREMMPYIDLLMPELKKTLLDPHPEVRTVAARALGSLVRGMGEERFSDLIPWLLRTMRSEGSSVERSGGAQGLSEVLAACGRKRFELLLPEILSNCAHKSAAVRDGFLVMFKFLPISFGQAFQNYLSRVLPSILNGLADEAESVREASLSACHVFVEQYAVSSLPLLLPAVEEGLFSDSWRIRQSSVELLGDLLFKVAGTSGKAMCEGGSDDEEGASTEAQSRALLEVLGEEKRNDVLASLYMVRSDAVYTVRQAALHVWKTLVSNTPKTIKEILPLLMRFLIQSLASESEERKQTASRCLGELVRKLGERVLPSIIPILAQGLRDGNASTRQGVCMGLGEVMASSGKLQLSSFMTELIITIRDALCDSDPEVREAAGQAFNTLYKSAGLQALDEIIPSLLSALEDEEEEISHNALDGLKQIISVRTSVVLPHILPKLCAPPLTEFNAQALGAIAEVAGRGILPHLSAIIEPLLFAAGEEGNQALQSAARRSLESLSACVSDEDCGEWLDAVMEEGLSSSVPEVRRGSAFLLGYFCKNSKADLEEDLPSLLSSLVVALTDPDELTVKNALSSLHSLLSTIPRVDYPSFIKTMREAIASAREREIKRRGSSRSTLSIFHKVQAPEIEIRGFCMPKAIQPVLPIFLQGLMNGSADTREQAAEGLSELIDVTNEISLRPFVIQITGPLIRVIGDRFPASVKSSILKALFVSLSKGGPSLKPFLPQLQTSFLKCLQGGDRVVSLRAARSLGLLSQLNPRVDALVNDMLTLLRNVEPVNQVPILMALKSVIKRSGKSISPPVLSKAISAALELIQSLEGEDRAKDSKNSLYDFASGVSTGIDVGAKVVGNASKLLSEEAFDDLILSLSPSSSPHPASSLLSLSSTLKHCEKGRVRRRSEKILVAERALAVIKAASKSEKPFMREGASRCLQRLLSALFEDRSEIKNDIGSNSSPFHSLLRDSISLFMSLLKDEVGEVRRKACGALKRLCKVNPTENTWLASSVGPAVAACLRDASQPVRLAAERTAYRLFQLSKGSDFVSSAQKFLTGLEARRLAKASEISDVSDDSEEEHGLE